MAISLKKGQKVNLKKEDGNKLENFYVGANWGMITEIKEPGFLGKLFGAEPRKVKYSVDLDLAAILYDKDKKLYNVIFFNNLKGKGIQHSGDDLTGDEEKDEEDNEVIEVKLNEVPEEVNYIIFTLNSYNGVEFDKIPYANIRLYEGEKPGKPKEVFVTYKVDSVPEFKGKLSLILGALIRKENGEWDFKAIGKPTEDKRLNNIVNTINTKFDELILSD